MTWRVAVAVLLEGIYIFFLLCKGGFWGMVLRTEVER